MPSKAKIALKPLPRITRLQFLPESGGDNLAATFSPELADLAIYVIDVAGGEGVDDIARFVVERGGLNASSACAR